MVELREKEQKITLNLRGLKGKITRELLVTVIFSMLILISAILVKIKMSDWIFSNIGEAFTHTLDEPVNGSVYWYFEIYSDADYYYEAYLDAFRGGWNPYKRYTDRLDFYVYGPIFIYGLYFTSLLVQLFNPSMDSTILMEESVKWTAINFDAFSAVMVYLIIINFSFTKERKIYKHVLGLVGAFTFIFMPFNLMYVDSYYLNIPQMTFFTLLGFLLMMKKKYKLTAYSLTLAWLTKQMPLFLVIPIFSMIWKEHDLKTAIKRFLRPFLLSTLLLSVPWIFITPVLYFGRILGAGRSLWYVTLDPSGNGHGTTLAHSILYGGAEGLAQFYVWINIPMIPFFLFYGFSLFIGHFNGKKLANDDKMFTYYITWIVLISHTFISRGLFKYYDAFYTPFFVLSAVILSNQLIEKTVDYIRARKLKNSPNKDLKSTPSENWEFGGRIFEIVSILTITLGVYYYSWIIMIKSRFLHPLFLLIWTMVISLLIPWRYYKEMGKKGNYKQLLQDFREFFGYIKKTMLKLYGIMKIRIVFLLLTSVLSLTTGVYFLSVGGTIFTVIMILGFLGFALLIIYVIWSLIKDMSIKVSSIFFIKIGIIAIVSFILWVILPGAIFSIPPYLTFNLVCGVILLVFGFVIYPHIKNFIALIIRTSKFIIRLF